MNLRQTEPESQLHKVVRHSKNISLYIAGDLKGTKIGRVHPAKFQKGRTQCRELPLCAGSGDGCLWQALPSPVQCEETATRTRDLPVTGGKTLPLAPGPPFI